jgi:hypothetical protein
LNLPWIHKFDHERILVVVLSELLIAQYMRIVGCQLYELNKQQQNACAFLTFNDSLRRRSLFCPEKKSQKARVHPPKKSVNICAHPELVNVQFFHKLKTMFHSRWTKRSNK